MILFSPPYSRNSIYRPVTWYFSFQAANLIYAEVRLVSGGQLVAVNQVRPVQTDFTNTSFFLYDASKLLQSKIGIQPATKTNIFPTPLDGFYEINNATITESANLLITYYALGPDNTPVVVGGESTGAAICVNSCVQIGELESLEEYVLGIGFILKKILTRRPPGSPNRFDTYQKIKNYQTLNLTYFPDRFTTVARITFTRENLTFIGEYFVKLFTTGVARTVGLGLKQLETAPYLTGAPVLPDNEIKYMTIELGNGTGFSFVSQTVQYCYNIDYCNKGLEVHFMNDLSGFDSFIFDNSIIKERSTKGLGARKGLTVDFTYLNPGLNQEDYGRFKYNNEDTKEEIKIVSQDLTPNEVQLLTPLIYSPEVYIIENGLVFSVQVLDTVFVVDDLNNSTTRLELTIVKSIDRFVQIR